MNDTILVAWDGSAASRNALAQAVRLVGDGTIVLFHSQGSLRTKAELLPMRESLAAAARALVAQNVRTRVVLGKGAPGAAISRAIAEHRPDLAIAGTRAKSRLTSRSTSVSLLRRTRVPLLVTREGAVLPVHGPRRVIVGIDFGAASMHAAEEGARLAKREGGTLVLVHVLRDSIDARREVPLARTKLEEIAATLPLPASSLDWFVTTGHPARVLLAETEGDPGAVIVVGTRDRGIMRRALLGSVAEEILRTAPGAVLIAHAHGGRGDVSLALDGAPVVSP